MSNRNVDRYDTGVKRESRVAPSDGYRISSLFETTVVLNAYGEDFAYRPSSRDSKPAEGGRWVGVPQAFGGASGVPCYENRVSVRADVSVYDNITSVNSVAKIDATVCRNRAACMKVRN